MVVIEAETEAHLCWPEAGQTAGNLRQSLDDGTVATPCEHCPKRVISIHSWGTVHTLATMSWFFEVSK